MGDTTKYKVEDMIGKSFNKWIVLLYYGLGKGEMEEYWHQHFKDKHHDGEWYCLDENDIDIINTRGCEI